MRIKRRLSRVIVILGGVAALLVLAAVSAPFLRDWFVSPRLDLSGAWRISLPQGSVKQVTIRSLGDNRYFFKPLVFAGEYELRGDRLEMVHPTDPRLTEFVWQLQPDGSLTLVAEPPGRKTGARYAGASLSREKPSTSPAWPGRSTETRA